MKEIHVDSCTQGIPVKVLASAGISWKLLVGGAAVASGDNSVNSVNLSWNMGTGSFAYTLEAGKGNLKASVSGNIVSSVNCNSGTTGTSAGNVLCCWTYLIMLCVISALFM